MKLSRFGDKFLQKGQVIVSQKGRAYPEQIYRAQHGSGGRSYPIVDLVNRNTASAAEIVSGALQDHDRAIVAGETTFGKGLVQTVYPLSENTGLALTTYHYYTPSGRLIQRNYNGVSLYDYYYNHDGAAKADSPDREVKMTDSGRTVYGGGGITPDDKIDTPRSDHFQDELLEHTAFFTFATHYLANRTVTKDFVVDDAVMAEFKKVPDRRTDCLHRPGLRSRDRLGEGQHQGRDIYFAVWSDRRSEGPRGLGPDDQLGDWLPAAGAALEDRAKQTETQRATASLHSSN